MKLIINTIKRVSVFVNGEGIEPVKIIDDKITYELNVIDGIETIIDIVHYDTQREFGLFQDYSAFSAFLQSVNEGFNHYFFNSQITLISKAKGILEYRVVESKVHSGLITYSTCKLECINKKHIQINTDHSYYYASKFSELLAILIPMIKWFAIFLLLLCFEISWGSAILHHSAAEEIYTNLLGPVHLYVTIPIITISALVFFVMDIRGLLLLRSIQNV